MLYQLSYLGTWTQPPGKNPQYTHCELILAGELKDSASVADRSFALPAQLLRRLVPPAAFSAIAAALGAAVSVIRRRTREPALPRMSEEWLRNLDQDSDRHLDHWRDSW